MPSYSTVAVVMAASCEDSYRKSAESKKEFESERRMHLGGRKLLRVVEDMMKRKRHAFYNGSLISTSPNCWQK